MAISRSVLISGGGIAGLTAALCLSKIGYRVEVFERSETYDNLGAGIQLSANALRILDGLDVGRLLRLSSTSPQAIRITSAYTGGKISEVPLGADAIIRFGLPYICIHRADLHQALLTACDNDPDIRINMNSVVTDCVSHPNGVSALVLKKSGMRTVRGKLFVSADGIHSKIRKEIFDAPAARHTGFEAWRAMIPAEKVPARFALEFTHLIWGRGKHAVLYPVRNGRYLNVVIVTKSRKKTDEVRKKEDPKHLKFKTFFWNSKFKILLNGASDWSVWPILETPPTNSWHNGPMVMIGDAAHGMEPYSAQGAAMAIEDAKVLADSLAEEQEIPKALSNFQKARSSRVKKVAKLARTNRQLYHMGFPFSTVRNIGMVFMSGKSLLERQAWIYDWRAKK